MERGVFHRRFSGFFILAMMTVLILAGAVTVRADVPVMTTNDFAVSSIYASSGLQILTAPHTGYILEAQLRDYHGNPVASGMAGKDARTVSVYHSIARNRAYYIAVRLIDGVNAGAWSKTRGVALVYPKISLSNGGIKIKMPKLRGIRYANVYMSTSPDKGYKKVARLKSNQSKVLYSFRNKAFQKYKRYYYRVYAVLADGTKSDTYTQDGFYIYTTYRR